MGIPDFIHIHNHSTYSKFDGFSHIADKHIKLKYLPPHYEYLASKYLKKGKTEEEHEVIIPGLASTAKELGMSAVGLTDHGTFAGAIEMLKTCRKVGIKPILGMEAYLSRDHKCHSKKGQPDGRSGNRHINLIAQNFAGYKNVCRLAQKASLHGSYYDPRVDFELLEQHKEGLIVTSACLSNLINSHLLHDRYDKAKQVASTFKDVFGENFYLEMMFHGINEEAHVLSGIQKLGKELDIKVIITNDCHYLRKEESQYHEVLMCMSTNRCIKDPNRLKFPYPEFYFKSKEEIYKIFNHVPEYMVNTLEIAEKCDYTDIVFIEDGGPMRLPIFQLPEGFSTPHEYLKSLAIEGLKRLKLHQSKPHIERLKQELMDIELVWKTKRYDFATYFLIVHDMINFAKQNKIECSIRGSGFGSVLLQVLGITEGADPLEYQLLWERFLGFDGHYFISEEDVGIKRVEKPNKMIKV